MECIMKKYTKSELILAAETLEEYGEYLYLDLVGYTPDELMAAAFDGRE